MQSSLARRRYEALPLSVPATCPHGDERLLAARLRERHLRQKRAPGHLLLCFDGSDGLATAAICMANPDVAVTVVARPEAVARTELLLDTCGLSMRTHTLPGSPAHSPVVIAFDSIVIFDRRLCPERLTQEVIQRLAASLAPGGEICVFDPCDDACVGTRVSTCRDPGGLHRRLGDCGFIAAEYAELCSQCTPGAHPVLHFAQTPRLVVARG